MALERDDSRAAVPVRSVLLGSSLAVALVAATLTFGSSLATLVANPPLYGWNWSYILNPIGSGNGNVPPIALTMLHHDKYVAAYTGADFFDVEIDGQGVPILQSNVASPVAPPILSGHGVQAAHQVVLGAATMAQLHKRLGQYVTTSYGSPKDAPLYVPPTRLRIVGTATFPAIGFASTVSDHTSMGTGALMSFQMLPKAFLAAMNNPNPLLNGPNLVLIRLKPDVPPQQALASLEAVAHNVNVAFLRLSGGPGINVVVVQGVQRPAEIVNYRTMGLTPALLVSGLALGAVVALALTLERVGAPASPGPGLAQDHRVRPPSARCRRGVAGVDRRAHRHRHRHPLGDRRGTIAVGPLRAPDLCSPVSDGVARCDRIARRRHHRAGQRGRRLPGAGCGADTPTALMLRAE